MYTLYGGACGSLNVSFTKETVLQCRRITVTYPVINYTVSQKTSTFLFFK